VKIATSRIVGEMLHAFELLGVGYLGYAGFRRKTEVLVAGRASCWPLEEMDEIKLLDRFEVSLNCPKLTH